MHQTPLERITELELWRADIMDFIYEVHDRMHPYSKAERKDSLRAICKRVSCDAITSMKDLPEDVNEVEIDEMEEHWEVEVKATRNPFKGLDKP